MRALIAHRRLATSTDGTQMYELAIGARSFACFNGFNEPTAFTKKDEPEVIHMVTALDGRFNNSNGWLETAGKRTQFTNGKTLGAWECVAIGWIYHGAQPNANGPMHGRSVPPSTHPYDFTIGNALRREGFMGRYYDAWYGMYRESLRQLTPMETYLSRVFQDFEKEDRVSVPGPVQAASAFAAAVSHNAGAAGCLYQFVGSERPSGQAVAFLQTFRNVAEVQYTGWAGAAGMKYNLLIQAAGLMRQGESIYPLMDHLVNYGTDNAITCYAGSGVMLHGMKYGFWSLREFFANTNSMVEEGRYNKGAQSNNLGSNYRRRFQAAAGPSISQADALFTTVKNAVVQTPADVSALVTYERILQNTSRLDAFIETIATKIREVSRSSQAATISAIFEQMRAHPDVRTPVAPPAPPAPAPRAPVAPTAAAPQGAAQSATPRNTTAGAAVGFTQWTSAAVH